MLSKLFVCISREKKVCLLALFYLLKNIDSFIPPLTFHSGFQKLTLYIFGKYVSLGLGFTCNYVRMSGLEINGIRDFMANGKT